MGDELVYEKRGSNTELYYFYDESGNLSGIRYILNGQVSDVVVVTNWRGDVEALYDLNGNQVAKYTYDAWGNQSSIRDKNGSEITSPIHIATVNPFRYRGYYLDTETSLYYLQSRYYDAQTHRFINEDSLVSEVGFLQGYNLYAYCQNNPINVTDKEGNWPKWIKKAAASVKKTANSAVASIKKVFSPKKASKGKNIEMAGLPAKGKPNSKVKSPDGKQEREYGPDGKAKRDTDYGHAHHHPDLPSPHHHDWDWDKTPPRGPAYSVKWEPIVGALILTATVIGIVWVTANDVTGVGVADDWLIAPLAGAASKGAIMLIGG